MPLYCSRTDSRVPEKRSPCLGCVYDWNYYYAIVEYFLSGLVVRTITSGSQRYHLSFHLLHSRMLWIHLTHGSSMRNLTRSGEFYLDWHMSCSGISRWVIITIHPSDHGIHTALAHQQDGWKFTMKYFQNVVDTVRDLMSPTVSEQVYKNGTNSHACNYGRTGFLAITAAITEHRLPYLVPSIHA